MSCPKYSELMFSKVFHNAVILGNILEYLAEDFTQNLNIRLVNKSVNEVFLGLIRRNQQKMKIEIVPNFDRKLGRAKHWIYINYRLVSETKVEKYFRFLHKIGTEVWYITTKNLRELDRELGRKLHDTVLFDLIGKEREKVRRLIGLEEVCQGCPECMDMARRCEEYGPISLETLKSIQTPKHFKELQIMDELFGTIANYCVSRPLNETFSILSNTINPLISCNSLVILTNEMNKRWINEEQREAYSRSPWKVINLVLDLWKVKTIKLKVLSFYQEKGPDLRWLKDDSFLPITWHYSKWDIEKKERKFNQVSIDLSDSFLCSEKFRFHGVSRNAATFGNMIANLHKLFPTDKISLRFSHWYYLHVDGSQFLGVPMKVKVLENLLMYVKNERNLKVNVEFYSRIENLAFVNLEIESEKEELLEVPLEYFVKNYGLHQILRFMPLDFENPPSKFEVEKWNGRRLQMENIHNNLKLNVDFFVRENDFDRLKFSEELLESHPNALAKHFVS